MRFQIFADGSFAALVAICICQANMADIGLPGLAQPGPAQD